MIGYLMRNVFYKKQTFELTRISLVEHGFSVNRPFGAKLKLYHWKEVRSIRFSDNYNDVIVEYLGRQIILRNSNIGWYEFIQNVPSTFENFDFKYVAEFIDSLKPCGVCGIVAVREQTCIVCETIAWNDEIHKDKVAYLTSKQSEFYAELVKDGKEIKKIAEPEHGFKADSNWKLYL